MFENNRKYSPGLGKIEVSLGCRPSFGPNSVRPGRFCHCFSRQYLNKLTLLAKRSAVRSAAFEVARFEVLGDELVETKENYHNPTRKRGILGHSAEQPKINPSLTFRVVKVGNAQLRKAHRGTSSPANPRSS